MSKTPTSGVGEGTQLAREKLAGLGGRVITSQSVAFLSSQFWILRDSENAGITKSAWPLPKSQFLTD
jgi:hypothetical protein